MGDFTGGPPQGKGDPEKDLSILANIFNTGAERLVVTPEGKLVPEKDAGAGKKTVLEKPRQFYAEWYVRDPRRLAIEAAGVSRAGFTFTFVRQGSGYWEGALVSNRGNSYRVQVRYPSDYPASPPGSYIIDPPVRIPVHQYANGELCLNYPGDGRAGGWDPGVTTAGSIIAWTAHWLFSYEHWKATGEREWLGPAEDQSWRRPR